ncbi:glucose-6-phosphate isomerase [Candidatus Albibeggiatoa sp. nov. NOAA]|uniref:glucose-6-phosphate isomerase n=1 Tax=Candidatus Albibeggiatoa sp. nov. NOAA TaxID=3162724 RepID=UPI0032F3EA6B|nr:glucose-6-phosphate isomerase [Thiotrichaceae bacterium]
MQNSIAETEIWKQLQQHQASLSSTHLQTLFQSNPQRFSQFSLESCGLLLDYSRNHLTQETVDLLCQLAEKAQLQTWVDRMFNGEKINHTENRAVLHTALRNRSNLPVYVDGEDVMPKINTVLNQMQQFAESVRNGIWRGFTEKPIETIINIGIGGSDLGPAMVVRALKPYHHDRLTCHFISNVDATHLSEILAEVNPETTLFIIASKTFTTQETMLNAHSARAWFLDQTDSNEVAIARHFVAVSTNHEKVTEFGINPDNMFEFWDWVGGRYSLWSAIGLSIVMMIGMDDFKKLLAGAHEMDKHFQNAPLDQNMPVLLGLIGIWYNNFFEHAQTHTILPYDFALELLPPYLQQLIMESLGKHISREGETVNYATCPIIWGAPGNNGQHAFYQLLHQGTHIVPADFIIAVENVYDKNAHEVATLSNALAQTDALMNGRGADITKKMLEDKGETAEEIALQLPHRTFMGNKPSNVLVYQRLNPETLGALIALYEHKTFVQGVCWDLNPFDQWGVELGKQVANTLLPDLEGKTHNIDANDAVSGLLNYIKAKR